MNDELASARLVVAGLALGPAVLLAASLALEPSGSVPALDAVAPVVGLVLLPIAWRVRAALRGRPYLTGLLVPLALTEGGALLGIVAFALGGSPMTLLGLAMHLVLVGLIWPSEERLDLWREP